MKFNQQKPLPTIIDAMNDDALFGPWFKKRWLHGDSWFAWKVFLKAAYGLPMTDVELPIYQRHTGRTVPPTNPFKRIYNIKGRRAGGSRIAALIATYNSVFVKHTELQRGEVGVMPIIASDRAQAGVIFGYVANFFRDVALLRKMVLSETKDSLELNNGIRIEVHTCDYRSVRGYTMIGGVCDEVAFWPTDERAASPDKEIINAIEKGMANIPDAMLVVCSSPYAKVGEAWDGYERNYGKDTDELCWVGDSKSMNPTLSQKIIDRAYDKDPIAASAEYGAQFRSDVAGFLSPEAIAACVVPGRFELAPR